MASFINGIGAFTTYNIVSILRALPTPTAPTPRSSPSPPRTAPNFPPTPSANGSRTAGPTFRPANLRRPTPASPRGTTPSWPSTAVPTPTAPESWTERSRSWTGPASAATTRCSHRTAAWPTGVGSARNATAADSSTGPPGPPPSRALHRTTQQSSLWPSRRARTTARHEHILPPFDDPSPLCAVHLSHYTPAHGQPAGIIQADARGHQRHAGSRLHPR